jgi:hypothetical protein
MTTRSGSDSRGFCDLARADATSARLHVLGPSVNHGTNALDVGQPAPFTDVVSMGDVVTGHRTLAADFASLRHFRTPSRKPHMGVELNSTSSFDFQVMDKEFGVIPLPRRDRNINGGAKRRENFSIERRIVTREFSKLAMKNDTLIRRHAPDTLLDKSWHLQ